MALNGLLAKIGVVAARVQYVEEKSIKEQLEACW
jgi:hypothetical protein